MRSIAKIRSYGKKLLDRVPTGVLLALVVVFASTGAYGIGYIAGQDTREGKLEVLQVPFVAATLSNTVSTPIRAEVPQGGQYVASRNGTRYYFPWCGGAKNIKEENKVWFSTKEEAEAKGYTPAVNCKGL